MGPSLRVFGGPSAGGRFISPLELVPVVQGTQDVTSRRSPSALQKQNNDESYSTCLFVCWTGRRPHPPSFPKIGPVRSRLANTGAEPDRRLTACRLSLWWGTRRSEWQKKRNKERKGKERRRWLGALPVEPYLSTRGERRLVRPEIGRSNPCPLRVLCRSNYSSSCMPYGCITSCP